MKDRAGVAKAVYVLDEARGQAVRVQLARKIFEMDRVLAILV